MRSQVDITIQGHDNTGPATQSAIRNLQRLNQAANAAGQQPGAAPSGGASGGTQAGGSTTTRNTGGLPGLAQAAAAQHGAPSMHPYAPRHQWPNRQTLPLNQPPSAGAQAAQRWAQQQTAQRPPTLQAAAQARMDDFGGGNSHWAMLAAGGLLGGAARGAMGFTGGNLGALGEAQQARFGIEGAVGAGQAPGVMAKAREDAKSTFGMGYTDILNYQRMMLDAGESTDKAREAVLAMSDAVAKAGKGSDVLQRVVVNMAQIRQQSTLTRRDLRELDIAQLSGTRRLAAGLGVTQSELSDKMGRGEVSGEQAFQAIISQFQKEAGGYGKRVTEQTLPGQFEKTQEEFRELQELMGQGLAPTVGFLNDRLRGTIALLKASPRLAQGLGLAAGVGGVGLGAAAAAATAKGAAGTLGQAFPKLAEKAPALFGNPLQIASTNLNVASTNLNAAATKLLASGGVGTLPLAAGGAGAAAGVSTITPGMGGAAAGAATGGVLARGAALAGSVGPGLAGAAAGLGINDDLQSLGYSSGTAFASAATVGLAAAFVPGAAIPAAIATAFRFGFNQAVNVPQEDEAENGPRDVRGNIINNGQMGGTLREQAGKQWQRAHSLQEAAAQLNEEGTVNRWGSVLDKNSAEVKSKRDLETEAQSASIMAQMLSRGARGQEVKSAAQMKQDEWMAFQMADGGNSVIQQQRQRGQLGNAPGNAAVVPPPEMRMDNQGNTTIQFAPFTLPRDPIVADIDVATSGR